MDWLALVTWADHGGRRTDGANFIAHFLVDPFKGFQLARELVDLFIPFGQLLLECLNVRALSSSLSGILLARRGIDFPVTLGQFPLELVQYLGIGILAGAKLLNHHFPIKQVPHQTIGCLSQRDLADRYGRCRHDRGEPGPFHRGWMLLYLLEPQPA